MPAFRNLVAWPTLALLLLVGIPSCVNASVQAPSVSLATLGVRLQLEASGEARLYVSIYDADSGALLQQRWYDAPEAGPLQLDAVRVARLGRCTLDVQVEGQAAERVETRVLPGWIAVVPPLLAIGLAITLRQVVVALFAGLWVGALFVHGFNPLSATLRAVDTYVVGRLSDESNASVLLFTLLLGGMVGVVSRSGGARGIANAVTRLATTRRRGLLTTWVLGILIFFDDYANSLLVGPTMRPITDRLRVSREKLAFLVDATSAPVASIALISSWIGVEVGYIQAEFASLGIDRDAYWVFLQTLPYRFYPILMLLWTLFLILVRRDFGPMYKAELRAAEEGKLLGDRATPATDFESPALEPPADRPHRWWNAAVPIGVVLLVVVFGLYVDGRRSVLEANQVPTLRNIASNANSFKALLWAAFAGSVTAVLIATLGRVLSLVHAMEAWMAGLRSMLYALVILVLAWALGEICKTDLHTGDYLVSVLGRVLQPAFLPVLVFLVAAFTSFSTGSSWGTMGILFPLVVPLAHGIAPGDLHVLLGAISSILAGSVWGDHCSPISDTTILSSLATSCDHVDHVRTQLPYAMLVALVSMLLGDLPTGLGWYGPWVAMLLCLAVLVAAALLIGNRLAGESKSRD